MQYENEAILQNDMSYNEIKWIQSIYFMTYRISYFITSYDQNTDKRKMKLKRFVYVVLIHQALNHDLHFFYHNFQQPV